jgi:hypothetical protein
MDMPLPAGTSTTSLNFKTHIHSHCLDKLIDPEQKKKRSRPHSASPWRTKFKLSIQNQNSPVQNEKLTQKMKKKLVQGACRRRQPLEVTVYAYQSESLISV